MSFHSIGSADRAAIGVMRAAVLPQKGKVRDASGRAAYDEIIGAVAPPDGVAFEADTISGVAGWWCRPATSSADSAILYLHGGWYMMGTAKAYRHLAGHIAARAGAAAFIPDYALAPEHPFPRAIMDAEAVYRDMANHGIPRIAVVGDSAGGGLTLALHGRNRPVCAVALSPVTDLTLSGESWRTRADAEFFFTKPQAEAIVPTYVDSDAARDPLASPLFGDLTGLPPVQVVAGDAEVLLDDSVRYADRAHAAGVDVCLDVWEGMPHVFLTDVQRLRAADEALTLVGTFLAAHLRREEGHRPY